MDLVCRRVKVGPGAAAQDYAYQVVLPHPGLSSVPILPIRHHRESAAHSFCWGKPAPCSMDLALSTLNAFVPSNASEGGFLASDGQFVSLTAYRYHEAFVEEFLMPMPSAGGVVEEGEIRHWIALQLRMSQEDPMRIDLDFPATKAGDL